MTGAALAILVERTDPKIAIVRLNRSGALNALTLDMIKELRGALRALDEDPEVRAIILAGEGRAFCAGLDLVAAGLEPGGANYGAARGMALQESFGSIPVQMRRVRQPIIAVIQGAAVGAGLALALAADVRIVERSARLMIGALKIGLSAGETGISYHLPRLIGAGRAFEIMLTGRTVEAEEANAIGLASRLVDVGAGVAAALEIARAIAANSPYAVTHTKQAMWTNLDSPSLEAAIQLENHVQVVALLSEDFQEGARAFAEKRTPSFSGR